MKLFIKKVLFLLVVTVSTDLYAQNGSVSGVVYGEENHLWVPTFFLKEQQWVLPQTLLVII